MPTKTIKDDIVSENKLECNIRQLKSPELQTSDQKQSNSPKRLASKTASKLNLLVGDEFYIP